MYVLYVVNYQSRGVPTVVGPDHHSEKIATTINSLTSTKMLA